MTYLRQPVWIFLAVLLAACGDEDSGSTNNGDNDCGEHSSTGRDGLCVCDSGYDWCTADPTDFDCCPISSGPVCGNGVCEAGETNASCSGDCPATGPVCGNGSCESGETSANCAADCGPSGPVCGNQLCETGETSAGCPSDCPCSISNPNACSGDNICIDSSCVGAFGRIYDIAVLDGTVPERNGTEAWDALGGLPDPFVEISLNDVVVCRVSTRLDTLSPVWNEQCGATIPGGSTLGLDMWDEDVSSNDLISMCDVDLTAAQLRAGGGVCSGDGGARTLRFNIVPR